MNQAYFDAIDFDHDLGRTRGIDGALQMFGVDALLMPSSVASGPAAIAGYPIVTGTYPFPVYIPSIDMVRNPQ